MKCPRCQHNIPRRLLAKALGSRGGVKSTRIITPAQQRRMQLARAIKQLARTIKRHEKEKRDGWPT